MPDKTSTSPRDELYYWENVVFLVDDRLFKVPRRYFEEKSDIFRTIFTLPPGVHAPDGSRDDRPFRLDGVSHIDFQRLLRVMYPLDVTVLAMHQVEWISVLKLADMWLFEDIRELAIREISKTRMQPTDTILLGKEFHVLRWLLDGYVELAIRDAIFSLEEAEELGLETVVKLYGVREARFRNHNSLCPQIGSRRVLDSDYSTLSPTHPVLCNIYKAFETEIREVDPEAGNAEKMVKKRVGLLSNTDSDSESDSDLGFGLFD